MPPSPNRFGQAALAALLLSLTAGCATVPPSTDAEAVADFRQNNDPLEPTNRFFYRVDDGLDTYVLRPVAVAYRTVVPGAVRRPVHNLLSNIAAPTVFANDVLQAKPKHAGTTMMRFLINTTAGVGGLFDVATGLGYPAHQTDFGLTLAVWGVGEGPFLFLPVLGPSNGRDSAGYIGNIALDPFTYASFGGVNALRYSKYGLGLVDSRERLIETIDDIRKSALDPYATFRSLYQQNRRAAVTDARKDDAPTTPGWFSPR